MSMNISPSASAEAALFKFENHDNRMMQRGDKTSIIRRILEAVNPSAAANRYMNAAKIVSNGIGEIASTLVDAGTPSQYAAAQAYEIYRGAQKLSHVEEAVCSAERFLEDDRQYEMPKREFVDDFVAAAEDVNDRDVLLMFGRILAGEMESPGSFSKRTMDVLSKMNRTEAEVFQKVCGFSTYVLLDPDDCLEKESPVVALKSDDGYHSYNNGKVTIDEMSILNVIGILDTTLCTTVKVPQGVRRFFYTAHGIISVANDGDSGEKETEFSSSVFLPTGIELARICSVGSDPELYGFLTDKFKSEGFVVNLESTEG